MIAASKQNLGCDVHTATLKAWAALRDLYRLPSTPNPKLIGGTDTSAMPEIDVNPYKGPATVALRILKGIDETIREEAAEWGVVLQPFVAMVAADRMGWTLQAAELHEHPKGREWQRLSLDYVIPGERAPLEVKTAGHRSLHRWGDGPLDIPPEYYCQVQAQIEGIDAPHGYVAGFLAGQELRIYEVDRDAECGAMLVESCERFWTDFIKKGRLPIPSSPRDENAFEAYLQKKKDDGIVRQATADEIVEVQRLIALRDAAAGVGEELEKIEDKIKEVIGPSAGIKGPFGQVTWKKTKDPVVIDWQSIAGELRTIVELHGEAGAVGEIVKKHTKKRDGSRRFLFTPPKNEKATP